MTEAEARAAVHAGVPRETARRIDNYVELLRASADGQNLIAPSTVPQIWHRHILDSAQLVPLAPEQGLWIDIGSGAGLPGIVVALLRPAPMLLVEPRRLRAAFLISAIERLELSDRVTVAATRVESVSRPPVACIGGRAVASLDRLFAIAGHLANATTRWILPKGRSAAAEVAAARRNWHGDFALVPSLTDPEARIVVAHQVRPGKGP